jgi:iron(III) transport system permease protein
LVSAVYACVSTVKTLGAIIFIITPKSKVLSADVFEATVRGDVGDAAALSLVLMSVAAAGVLAIAAMGNWRNIVKRDA